jgi:hypothetical protein
MYVCTYLIRQWNNDNNTYIHDWIYFTIHDCCGNNGQADQVDNLYSLRVKSTLTEHKLKHLHLYKINGRSRLGKVEPIRSK